MFIYTGRLDINTEFLINITEYNLENGANNANN